jgi:hypothetical protein
MRRAVDQAEPTQTLRFTAPDPAASSIASGGKAPTDTVTGRSRRSLSGSSSRAGRRSIDGWSTVHGVGDQRRGGVGGRGGAGEPGGRIGDTQREERPPRPEVAMPRTGLSWLRMTAPSSARAKMPARRLWPARGGSRCRRRR